MKPILVFSLILVLQTSAHGRQHKASDISATIQRASFYRKAIESAAARYSVSARLLWTIAYLESRFQPQLVSPKGARGMMQFIPSTGRRYGLLTLRDFHDPLRSIDAAARYVRDLASVFRGRIDLVLAGYNAGENAVINANYKVPHFRETERYVAQGLSLLTSGKRAIARIARFAPPMQTKTATRPLSSCQERSSPDRKTRSIYFGL